MKQQPVDACNVQIASCPIDWPRRNEKFKDNFLVLPDCAGRIA
jgi:hypothetical protein